MMVMEQEQEWFESLGRGHYMRKIICFKKPALCGLPSITRHLDWAISMMKENC